jgi:hypothetical protein
MLDRYDGELERSKWSQQMRLCPPFSSSLDICPLLLAWVPPAVPCVAMLFALMLSYLLLPAAYCAEDVAEMPSSNSV